MAEKATPMLPMQLNGVGFDILISFEFNAKSPSSPNLQYMFSIFFFCVEYDGAISFILKMVTQALETDNQ